MIKLLLFSQQFSIWFKILLGELLNNIISLFFILAVYFALWHFPQTIDLLLILNQADAFLFEVPLYFFLLTASSFLIWNIPKYFYYHNYKDVSFSNLLGFIPNQHYRFQNKKKEVSYSYHTRVHMRMVVPRILALLLLLISALSILNAMELFGLNNIYTNVLNSSSVLVFLIFFLLLLSEPRLYAAISSFFKNISRINSIVYVVSGGLIAFIIVLGILNTQAEKDLGILFIANCALTLFFFTISFNSYRFLKDFPNRSIFYGIILMVGFALLLSFLVLNFIPEWARGINPLSVLILSLLSLFMISFVLVLLGKKLKLPLFSITVILCMISSVFFSETSNHYQLDIKPTKVVRPAMDLYIYHWIKNRVDVIENSKNHFPVVLVSAEGGGSRAGLWSFLVHSYLYEKSNGKYFRENLLSLTGASGGSVGNAMFFAEAQNTTLYKERTSFKINADDNSVIKYKASAVYKENYLSISLLSLLGRDLFKEITGLFTFKNRGKLLEEQWNKAHKESFSKKSDNSILERDFLSFFSNVTIKRGTITDKSVPPLLLINTTHTQTGNYNIISPVRYSHLKALTGMNDFIDNLQSSYPNSSIGLSTAMRINASFPYITPVGEVRKLTKSKKSYSDQYADAGYYDNIGGRVSRGVEQVFRKVLQDSFTSLESKIKIKHLVITNDEERKIVKTQTQFAAPLTTLQNVRYGHTQEIIKKLGKSYAITLRPTTVPVLYPKSSSPMLNKEKLLITPVLPLGRYLSTVAIRSMEARLEEVKSKLDSIL